MYVCGTMNIRIMYCICNLLNPALGYIEGLASMRTLVRDRSLEHEEQNVMVCRGRPPGER